MNDDKQRLRVMLRDVSTAIRDLRFIQANAITCLNLTGKAYLEAKAYMNRLAALQEQVDKEITE